MLRAWVDQAPDLKDDIKTHFICFTQVDGELYELGRPAAAATIPRHTPLPFTIAALLLRRCPVFDLLSGRKSAELCREIAGVRMCTERLRYPSRSGFAMGQYAESKAAGFGLNLSFEIP